MSNAASGDSLFHGRVRASSRGLFWLGLAMVVLGLAAIIEETNGDISYFALAHAPGKPDFHHRDSFVISIEARQVKP